MIRRTKLLAVLLLTAAVVSVAIVLGTLARHVPTFYTEAGSASYLATSERSSALMTRIQDLQNDIRTKPEWSASLAVGDFNCFSQEMFCERASGLASLLPENCHTPRLAIDGDRLKLGCTYGHGFWSSVVWVELRVWLPKNDTNVIAVEIMGINAGSLPISAQSMLENIRDAVHDANVDVSWYRNEGRPVGLFRFYANQPRPATQIHTLKMEDGRIALGGRTRLENNSARE